MKKLVLLLGSYNGQDSLGDKCLLRSVADRFHRHLPQDIELLIHLHNPQEINEKLSIIPVKGNKGIQSLYWYWDGLISRVINSIKIRKWLSEQTFFLALNTIIFWLRPGEVRLVKSQLKRVRFIFIFGGTNFSKQWWWLNIVPYIMTAKLVNKAVYFGPQQYGPMLPKQKALTQRFIKRYVKDLRLRNSACFNDLGLDIDLTKLTKDEVYSNTELYPNPSKKSSSIRGRKKFLVNFRGGEDFLLEDKNQEIKNLGELLTLIGAQLNCDFEFFSVSGKSFSDDTLPMELLRSIVPQEHVFSLLPYTDEFDLIEAAKLADGCISMSFHGCILAMIGGCPAIPLTSGDYYNHKYIGFETYNPQTPIPIIYSTQSPTSETVEQIITYFDQYDIAAVAQERIKNHLLLEAYYKSIVDQQIINNAS